MSKNEFRFIDYQLIPIRFEDRYRIMQWRNEQMYHLRQQNTLREEDQDRYFTEVVQALFDADQPDQILFSFLEQGQLVGYGGLVHIHWTDQHAEVSFLMDTEKESSRFEKYWSVYLSLLKTIAFDELKLHKLFTYAFDLRPHLYPVLQKAGFHQEAVLKEHCRFDGAWKDVVIHALLNPEIDIRPVQWEDVDIIYLWANDEDTRKNSFFSGTIRPDDHRVWFRKKMEDPKSILFMCTVKDNPAAFIRFDKDGEDWVMGINISPAYRNKKLGDTFIRKGIQMIKEGDTVLAYIKSQNTASVKTFEKAGFVWAGEKETSGQQALVFKYKRDGK